MIYDRDTVYAILDEALTCAVGFVIDGAPRVLPMLHVRLTDTLYLHGSTGGTLALTARDDGVAICVGATLLDGLVFARAQSHSSLNYRSVIAHGTARPVVSSRARAGTGRLGRQMAPGRAADSRPRTGGTSRDVDFGPATAGGGSQGPSGWSHR
jgi:nitroimidazol reductase NimA-like FMN-containing flavoprotein (pyridoxamine 5'-phosphate oxidase superfamily)